MKYNVNVMVTIASQDWKDLQIIWDYLRVDSQPSESADAIVVGGAALMTDMAQRAAELYHKGVAKIIIVSGFASEDNRPGESEAALINQVLLANDVPHENIFLDEKASNTGENIINSAQILRDLRIAARKVVLVHKPFMTRRFLATAEVQWPDPRPEFYVTSINMSFECYFYMHHQAYPDDPYRLIRSMLGDYERIKEYPKLGFSSQQEFSEIAECAYRRLIANGFSPR